MSTPFRIVLALVALVVVALLSRALKSSQAKQAAQHQAAQAAQAEQARREEEARAEAAARLEEIRRRSREEAEARARRAADFDARLQAIPAVEITPAPRGVPRREDSVLPDIKISNITRATRKDKIYPFVVVDVETTGLKPLTDEIVEVAAVRFDGPGEPVSIFHTYVKPKKKISAAAAAVNHITEDMLAEAPRFGQIAKQLSAYLDGCAVVGHNLKFDARFLYMGGVDLPAASRYYDTTELARLTLRRKEQAEDGVWKTVQLLPDRKLETLLAWYGIDRAEAHRADSDALAAGLAFEKLLDDKLKAPEEPETADG